MPRSPASGDSEQRGIVIIHQELALSPQLSIAENIFLGNERATPRPDRLEPHQPEAGAAAGAGRPAGEPGHAGDRTSASASSSSSRSPRRCPSEVRLLILDEPTAALNDDDSAHLLDLLRGLRDEGITCVIISHKLNEIDGDRRLASRSCATAGPSRPSTCRATRSPRTGSSPAWSAATSTHRFPPHEPHDRRGGAADRGLDRAQPHPARPGRRRRRQPDAAPRRDRRAGRADGRRPHRAGDERVRPQPTAPASPGGSTRTARQIEVRTVRDAIRHGIAYATEDRKRYGLNLIEDIKRNVSAAGAGQARPARLGRRQRGVPGRRRLPARA